MMETHKRCRALGVFSRQRLPRAGAGRALSAGLGQPWCSRKASQPDTGPPDRKSLSSWDSGKGLVCTREGAKARMCMYVKLSGNKQGAPPELIRDGHLLCAAHTIP